MKTKTIKIIKNLFETIDTAAMYGSFWVSKGGGTVNVMSGVIAEATDEDFKEVLAVVNEFGELWKKTHYVSDGPWIEALADWTERHKQGRKYGWNATSIAGSAIKGVVE
jgi:hypothetical protein